MDDADRHLRLVRFALGNDLRNCIHWTSEELMDRVTSDPVLQGLTTGGIVERLLDWGHRGCAVSKATERSDECRHSFEHLFAVLIPVEALPRNLYVKMGLLDDDEECPEVAIVSCHLTSYPR